MYFNEFGCGHPAIGAARSLEIPFVIGDLATWPD
jgi:hypothetical protein